MTDLPSGATIDPLHESGRRIMMTRLLWVPFALFVATGVASAQSKPDYPPWTTFGKDTAMQAGFWTTHQDKKQRKFYVEIGGSAINTPFLLATSIAGGTRQAGWQWNDWYLVWQVHDKRLVLLQRNAGYKSDASTKEAIARTYTDTVIPRRSSAAWAARRTRRSPSTRSRTSRRTPRSP
jgi:FAD/FMN-containing dehydrogenase